MTNLNAVNRQMFFTKLTFSYTAAMIYMFLHIWDISKQITITTNNLHTPVP